MRCIGWTMLAVVALTPLGLAAAPATTRAAGDADVIINRIDGVPTLITGAVKNQSASELFSQLTQQAGGGMVAFAKYFEEVAAL